MSSHRRNRIRTALLLGTGGVALLLGCSAGVAHAGVEDFPKEPDFLRYVNSPEEGEALETSILSYVDAEGRQVDLVAAVHVGEHAYYSELNERFLAYDAVLYELVAERGARPGAREAAPGVLSFFQLQLKQVLDLEFQLEGIDYSPANFVHADVSPAEMDELFAERGDSFFGSLLRAALKSAQAQSSSQANPFALLAAFFAKDQSTALKRVLAQSFEDIGLIVAGFEDESGTSVLVTERNLRAMEVLDEELEGGRTRLAIFYGAAHMDDFHERLIARGFEGRSAEWLNAWTIAPAAEAR